MVLSWVQFTQTAVALGARYVEVCAVTLVLLLCFPFFLFVCTTVRRYICGNNRPIKRETEGLLTKALVSAEALKAYLVLDRTAQQ